MKKILSLLLAGLLCAAMSPAVMADEVPAAVSEVGTVDEAILEDLSAHLVMGVKEVTITPDHIVAASAVKDVEVTVDTVVALAAGRELTAELVAATITALGYPVTAEEIVADVFAVASPMEKYSIEYMSTEFVAYLCSSVYGVEVTADALQAVAGDLAWTPELVVSALAYVGVETTVEEIYDACAKIFESVTEPAFGTLEVPVTEEIVVEEVVIDEPAVEEIAIEEAAASKKINLTNDPFLAPARRAQR